MGVDVSRPSREYTELYLPSECFRRCPGAGDRCCCDRGRHRDSRYYYVERGGDGRERFYDPMDYMDRFMMGGGGGWSMPWKDVSHWTSRDYDKLGEIMKEYSDRNRGRQMNAWDSVPPWMSMWPAMMMADEMRHSCSPRRHKSRRSRGGYGFDDELVQRYVQGFGKRLGLMEDLTMGSDAENAKAQFSNRIAEMIREVLREQWNCHPMNQMNGAHGGYGTGMGMPGTMYPNAPWNQGNPQCMPMGGMMPPGYANAPGGYGMNYAAQMPGQMPGGAGMNPMNPYGDETRAGGFGRRRPFRTPPRRGLSFDDEEDELDDMLGPGPRGRRLGRRWPGRNFDDGFGGLDEGPSSPRPTNGPRRGPNGPNNLNPGGGVPFEDEATQNLRNVRTSPQSSPLPRMSGGATGRAVPTAASRVTSPMPGMPATSAPLKTTTRTAYSASIPNPEDYMHRADGVDSMFDGDRVQDLGDAAVGVIPASGAQFGGLPPAKRPMHPTAAERNVRFDDELYGERGQVRPRSDEENRGEPPAGGTMNRRTDAEPT